MPYGRNKANTQHVAAQAAFLSDKLNFGPPSKAAAKTPPRANGVSKDPKFGANRAAIADKLNFGGKRPPPQPAANSNIPKPSGGKEFQNQKAALAAKLNFRPPLPGGDPRARPPNVPSHSHPGSPMRPAQQHVSAQNGTQDFSAHRAAIASQLAIGRSKPASPPKPNPPPPRRRNNDNDGTDFSNQKQALASKLVFRPPLQASPTSGGPQMSPLRQTTGMPRSPGPQEPSYTPTAAAPPGHMGLAAQAADMATGLKSHHPDDATTTTSGAASVHSARSMNNPPAEPEMSFAPSDAIRKDNPAPAGTNMKYVRSYRIGGGTGEDPKEEPTTTQVIPKQDTGDENGRIQVVLVSEKYEWGTKPLDKRYRRNRVTVKHLTTNTPAEERKKERNKNGGGGCAIM
jgi:hypothetical protein